MLGLKLRYTILFLCLLFFLLPQSIIAGWNFDFQPPTTSLSYACCPDSTCNCKNLSNNSFSSTAQISCVSKKICVKYQCNDNVNGSGCYQVITTKNPLTDVCSSSSQLSLKLFYDNTGIAYSGPHELSDNKRYYIYAASLDKAGNQSSLVSISFEALGHWFKLSNASFNNLIERNNFLPLHPSSYDSDDRNQRYLIRYLIVNSPGVVVQKKSINLGSSCTDCFSSSRWRTTTNYPLQQTLDAKGYLAYVKSFKQYKKITDLSEIEDKKINWYEIKNTDLTISDTSNFNNKKVVMLVTKASNSSNGELIFAANFQPNDAAVAFISEADIVINNNVNSINAIIIGKEISLTSSGISSTPLKIKGNIISTGVEGINTSVRRRTDDASKPSFFVVFDPALYINLLPYISISKYDMQILR